jgi:pyruvate kinase
MNNRIDHQKTKIVATAGPACRDFETLFKMVKEGVDVFRLNLSHGKHEDHQKAIENIVTINDKYNLHVGILADLQGPKLRVGEIKDGQIELKNGDEIEFTNKQCVGTAKCVYMSYDGFAEDVKVGERVLIDDGKLVFEVQSSNLKDAVVLKVLHGGILSSNKGVNLPDTKISLPCLTEKDLHDLKFLMTQPVNWIALSFVRSANDIRELREIITKYDHQAKIIAKIEKPEAIDNIKSIIKASNAIMVARGDLGVEIPMQKVPAIQKNIIKMCIQRARPVIVATQMMESMIENPSPTRAEVTDVANAVLDGTDAVMLSAETAMGKFPIKVVNAMNLIIGEAEKNYEPLSRRPKPNSKSKTFYSDVICFNAAKTAEDIEAKAIVSLTATGYTGYKISSYRPKSNIYIFSSKKYLLGTLNLIWGVRGYYYDRFTTTDGTIEDVINILKSVKKVKLGDLVVNTGSMPIKKRFRTNMLKVTIVE